MLPQREMPALKGVESTSPGSAPTSQTFYRGREREREGERERDTDTPTHKHTHAHTCTHFLHSHARTDDAKKNCFTQQTQPNVFRTFPTRTLNPIPTFQEKRRNKNPKRAKRGTRLSGKQPFEQTTEPAGTEPFHVEPCVPFW